MPSIGRHSMRRIGSSHCSAGLAFQEPSEVLNEKDLKAYSWTLKLIEKLIESPETVQWASLKFERMVEC